MSWSRIFLYSHCLYAALCIGVLNLLSRRIYAGRWPDRRQLELFLEEPPIGALYLVCLVSCFAFPLALLICSEKLPSGRRRNLMLALDLVLAGMQLLALMAMYPIRE